MATYALNTKDFTKRIPGLSEETANASAAQYPADYKKLYESALGTVKNQYQTQRDNLNQQQAAIPYQYQGQRDTVSSQAAQTARTLDETNAQRGLYNSGSARTDLSRNAATRDSGINDINNTQNQAVQSLRNSLNQLNAQEATDIAGLQGTEAQNERNYALQEASLTGQYNGTNTLAKQIADSNTAYNNAALTGTYNGTDTLANQQYKQNLALQQQAQATDKSNQNYSNQLALLQALQNYNLGTGQITDSLPQISGYNYGDTLKRLLVSLGTAA